MAARLRKTHQDDVLKKYFVYEVLDCDGVVIYVGKGSGRRHVVSCKERGGAGVRIVKRFSSEQDAYRFEVKRISDLGGLLNKCKGGNGAKTKKTRRPKWLAEIEHVGTRVYAARLLMKYLPYVDQSKVEQIRAIAYG